MNNTGMIRRIDELGRIVIPIEIRNRFDIKEKDPMEIYVDDGSIVIKKYETKCYFCENSEDLIEFRDKLICNKCIKDINKL